MKPVDIKQELSSNTYPGRGIIIGKSEDRRHAVIAYFIMGRSVNSRNRVFETEGEGIRCQEPAGIREQAGAAAECRPGAEQRFRAHDHRESEIQGR